MDPELFIPDPEIFSPGPELFIPDPELFIPDRSSFGSGSKSGLRPSLAKYLKYKFCKKSCFFGV